MTRTRPTSKLNTEEVISRLTQRKKGICYTRHIALVQLVDYTGQGLCLSVLFVAGSHLLKCEVGRY